jgi:hypothetical protein
VMVVQPNTDTTFAWTESFDPDTDPYVPLLDLTDPESPTILTAGFYILAGYSFCTQTVAGKQSSFFLALDYNLYNVWGPQSAPLDMEPAAEPGFGGAINSSAFNNCSAGAVAKAMIRHNNTAPLSFGLVAFLTKLSA